MRTAVGRSEQSSSFRTKPEITRHRIKAKAVNSLNVYRTGLDQRHGSAIVHRYPTTADAASKITTADYILAKRASCLRAHQAPKETRWPGDLCPSIPFVRRPIEFRGQLASIRQIRRRIGDEIAVRRVWLNRPTGCRWQTVIDWRPTCPLIGRAIEPGYAVSDEPMACCIHRE